ncbi:cytochrome P450 [Pseudonocardia sp. ICBG601]|uniref:cytochrome P450 n=1 Tax=Pseudonocardia sp. ICBG601 TaxID=2846759 RepID=UPI001CF64A66|nr:cytochrome P450 [Pseudonocardia sp. ICBG601]
MAARSGSWSVVLDRIAPLILGYSQVRSLLNDRRLGNNGFYAGTDAERVRGGFTDEQLVLYWDVADFETKQLSRADGERHSRLRSIAQRAFTPRRTALLAEKVSRYADGLLDDLANVGDTVEVCPN